MVHRACLVVFDLRRFWKKKKNRDIGETSYIKEIFELLSPSKNLRFACTAWWLHVDPPTLLCYPGSYSCAWFYTWVTKNNLNFNNCFESQLCIWTFNTGNQGGKKHTKAKRTWKEPSVSSTKSNFVVGRPPPQRMIRDEPLTRKLTQLRSQ